MNRTGIGGTAVLLFVGCLLCAWVPAQAAAEDLDADNPFLESAESAAAATAEIAANRRELQREAEMVSASVLHVPSVTLMEEDSGVVTPNDAAVASEPTVASAAPNPMPMPPPSPSTATATSAATLDIDAEGPIKQSAEAPFMPGDELKSQESNRQEPRGPPLPPPPSVASPVSLPSPPSPPSASSASSPSVSPAATVSAPASIASAAPDLSLEEEASAFLKQAEEALASADAVPPPQPVQYTRARHHTEQEIEDTEEAEEDEQNAKSQDSETESSKALPSPPPQPPSHSELVAMAQRRAAKLLGKADGASDNGATAIAADDAAAAVDHLTAAADVQTMETDSDTDTDTDAEDDAGTDEEADAESNAHSDADIAALARFKSRRAALGAHRQKMEDELHESLERHHRSMRTHHRSAIEAEDDQSVDTDTDADVDANADDLTAAVEELDRIDAQIDRVESGEEVNEEWEQNAMLADQVDGDEEHHQQILPPEPTPPPTAVAAPSLEHKATAQHKINANKHLLQSRFAAARGKSRASAAMRAPGYGPPHNFPPDTNGSPPVMASTVDLPLNRPQTPHYFYPPTAPTPPAAIQVPRLAALNPNPAPFAPQFPQANNLASHQMNPYGVFPMVAPPTDNFRPLYTGSGPESMTPPYSHIPNFEPAAPRTELNIEMPEPAGGAPSLVEWNSAIHRNTHFNPKVPPTNPDRPLTAGSGFSQPLPAPNA
jgi:hypothetical protein